MENFFLLCNLQFNFSDRFSNHPDLIKMYKRLKHCSMNCPFTNSHIFIQRIISLFKYLNYCAYNTET